MLRHWAILVFQAANILGQEVCMTVTEGPDAGTYNYVGQIAECTTGSGYIKDGDASQIWCLEPNGLYNAIVCQESTTTSSTTAAAGSVTSTSKEATATTTNVNAPATSVVSSDTTAVPGVTGSTGEQCKCGIKKAGTRIFGGNNTEVMEYPWMVGIDFGNGRGGGCGGSLIALEWVLTARHCVQDDPIATFVFIGEQNWSADIPGEKRKEIEIEKIIHPLQKRGPEERIEWPFPGSDIALIKLKEKVDCNVYSTVCLPNQGENFVGQTAWVYGWGIRDGPYTASLEEISYPIVTREVCLAGNAVIGVNGEFTMWADEICAGADGIATCSGDSGGPLSVPDQTGQHTVVGVVSRGARNCSLNGVYDVYSSVSYHRDWIDQVFQENGGATLVPR